MLIDTHAHLGGEDVEESVALSGLKKGEPDIIIAASYDVESSARSVEIAKRNENVYAMVGVHPSNAQFLEQSPIEQLRALACDKNNKVLAIGEIGLDYHYDDTDKEPQKKWMREQIALSHELSLPVVFHVRDAYEDALEILYENKKLLTSGAIMHCYSGSKEFAAEVLREFDFYFSFSGVITFKNAKKFPDVIRSIPTNRILVETDSPYMSPEPHRGEKNVPANVRFVAAKVAETLGLSYEEVRRITGENACRLFGIKN